MPGKIFISYRREDDPSAAARVRDGLAVTFGKSNLFMDVDNLLAGQRFDLELTKALATCDVLIAVIGQRWMELLAAKTASRERDYVREEIAAALMRQIVVIPARVGREGQMPPLPRPEDLPEDVRELALYQKHDLAHERFARDIAELAEAITSLRKSQAAGTPRPSVAKAAPWGWIGASAATAVTLAYAGAYFAGVPLPVPGSPASMLGTAITTRDTGIEKARLEQETRARAEIEARARAEETERQQAAATRAEAERQAAEAKRRTELAAQLKRDDDARQKAEAESRRRAEEAERQRLAAAKAEEERQRAEAQIKADLEARARRDEEARRAAAEKQAESALNVETRTIANVEPAPARQPDKAPQTEAKPQDPHGLLGRWKCRSTIVATRTEDQYRANSTGRAEINIQSFDGKIYWAVGREILAAGANDIKVKYWFEGKKFYRQMYWSSAKGAAVRVTWPVEMTYSDNTMTGVITAKANQDGKEWTIRATPRCTR